MSSGASFGYKRQSQESSYVQRLRAYLGVLRSEVPGEQVAHRVGGVVDGRSTSSQVSWQHLEVISQRNPWTCGVRQSGGWFTRWEGHEREVLELLCRPVRWIGVEPT